MNEHDVVRVVLPFLVAVAAFVIATGWILFLLALWRWVFDPVALQRVEIARLRRLSSHLRSLAEFDEADRLLARANDLDRELALAEAGRALPK